MRIVGVGASAGGLAPLEQFFSGVLPSSGLAFVVVQHMDPHHKPLLAELLQRTTSMPVREVSDAQRVEPDTVYVIPPNTELTLVAGALHLAAPSQPRGHRLPIDVLFSSLARELGERAVGVILSGMGSDGTLGLQAIKACGGLTLAQRPESAQFDAMPGNAIAAGCVDIVVLPSEMPARLLAVAAGQGGGDPARVDPADGSASALADVLAQLHGHVRHDFGDYKPNTLVRRIGRRMAVHGLASMAAYADFARDNPQELDLLFKELLIGVTSFFRDPEVWQELKARVLPALIARHDDGVPLRAWTTGCSTGEEAYSLAMAFVEVLEALPGPPRCELQIFATDLNPDAIAKARVGRFACSIARDLTPERLSRFFTERADGYQIDKRIRDMVLFAQHDVTLDPPFTRLDILSCRNLMIYFGAALQRRLMPLFHYSLRPGGVLLLGSSETVGRAQTLFQPLSPKARLFTRGDNRGALDARVFPTHRRPASRLAKQEFALPPPNEPAANLQRVADQLLLQAFSPPAVLVNEGGDVVYINGRVGRYLEPASGKANWNIHVMAPPAIRAPLAGALRTALQQGTSVELPGLRLDDGSDATVNITVQPVVQTQGLDGMALIVFREPTTPSGAPLRPPTPGEGVDVALADELVRAREEVLALRQEMRSSQEELQAANEELQSANEELTTSKEEAQSMNEELQTINGELQSKLDDLALAQSDMQNLLNSTEIATLFLDNELNVRRFTEQIVRVVHLREGDVGRPFSELASTLIYPELHTDVKETLRTLAFIEKQIATTDGHWYTVRIMPYRTMANVIQGAVITFVDITVAKELESRLRKSVE